jgi:hypothetical protein
MGNLVNSVIYGYHLFYSPLSSWLTYKLYEDLRTLGLKLNWESMIYYMFAIDWIVIQISSNQTLELNLEYFSVDLQKNFTEIHGFE